MQLETVIDHMVNAIGGKHQLAQRMRSYANDIAQNDIPDAVQQNNAKAVAHFKVQIAELQLLAAMFEAN